MTFNPGFAITATTNPLGFVYGKGTFGPVVEQRTLDSIRASLRDPFCNGPDPVYAIAMDVGKAGHQQVLGARNLLFGAVTYAAGRLGDEPVRSQGHVHRKARNNPVAPPEVYEIWEGEAIVYMQEYAATDPGRCFAVHAGPGEVVVVPPGWAHATISANADLPLTFGAWCDRESAFEYGEVRAHHGLAWYPLVGAAGAIRWESNPFYRRSELVEKGPGDHSALRVRSDVPIYTQHEQDPDTFLFVSDPRRKAEVWRGFIP